MHDNFWEGFTKVAFQVPDTALAKMIANRAKRVGAVKDAPSFSQGVYKKLKSGLSNKLEDKGYSLLRKGNREFASDNWTRHPSQHNLEDKVLKSTKRENQMSAISSAQKMFPKK